MFSKKEITLFYLESPLQILSSIGDISVSKNPLILLFNKSSQTTSLARNINKGCEIYSVNNFLLFLLKIFYIKISFKISSVGIGDLRSLRALVILQVFKKRKIKLFDDGSFSIFFDKKGSINQNLKNTWIKKSLIENIEEKQINRITIFKHEILRKYKSVKRNNANENLKLLNLHKNTFTKQNKKTLFYVESTLQGWISPEYEKKIFSNLKKYSVEKNLDLVILLHRNTSLDHFNNLTKGMNINAVRLDYPIEAFYSANDSNNSIFSFNISTAAQTAFLFLKKSEILLVKLNSSLFFSEYRDFVKSFSDEIDSISIESKIKSSNLNVS